MHVLRTHRALSVLVSLQPAIKQYTEAFVGAFLDPPRHLPTSDAGASDSADHACVTKWFCCIVIRSIAVTTTRVTDELGRSIRARLWTSLYADVNGHESKMEKQYFSRCTISNLKLYARVHAVCVRNFDGRITLHTRKYTYVMNRLRLRRPRRRFFRQPKRQLLEVRTNE